LALATGCGAPTYLDHLKEAEIAAKHGDLEPALRFIWTDPERRVSEFMGLLGSTPNRPDLEAELVALYRLYPDSGLAGRSLLRLPRAPEGSSRSTGTCERRGCMEEFYRLELAKVPRPRLFFSEACASLGLQQIRNEYGGEPGSGTPRQGFDKCLTVDGYDVSRETMVHLLWQRARGELVAPITGATLPFPVEPELQDRGWMRLYASPEDGFKSWSFEVWDGRKAWFRKSSDGRYVEMPGPAPTRFTVDGEPPWDPRAPETRYRMHADEGEVAAAWAALPGQPCPAAQPCADPLARMDARQPRPRLFYAEACASLSLRVAYALILPPEARAPSPTCVTADGYVVYPDQLVHHLQVLAMTGRLTPITGANLAPNGPGPRWRVDGLTETWDPSVQAWRGCCDAAGQPVVVPGPEPKPLDLRDPRPRGLFWEPEGVFPEFGG
jgi:hypothetical protein